MRKFFNPRIMVSVVAVVVGLFANEVFHKMTTQINSEIVVGELKYKIAFRASGIKDFLEILERHVESGKTSEPNISMSQLLLITSPERGLLNSELYCHRSEATVPMLHALTLRPDRSTASLLKQLAPFIEPDSNMQKILADAILSTEDFQDMINDIHGYKPKTTVAELLEGAKRQLNNLAKVTQGSYLSNGRTLIDNLSRLRLRQASFGIRHTNLVIPPSS